MYSGIQYGPTGWVMNPYYVAIQGAIQRGALPAFQSLASQMVSAMENFQAPPGTPGVWAEPTIRRAIERKLSAEGFEQPERAVRYARVKQRFGEATGQLAAASAARGLYRPADAATAALGAPSAELATGLAGLESAEAALAREERTQGMQTLAGLTPMFVQYAQRPREAFAGYIGELMRAEPTMMYSRRSPAIYKPW